MVIGRDALLAWYRLQNRNGKDFFPHFTIYTSDAQKGQKGRFAGSYGGDEESESSTGVYTATQGEKDLEDVLAVMSHNVKYVVRLKPNGRSANHAETHYLHYAPEQMAMRNGVPGVGSVTQSSGLTMDFVEQKCREAVEKFKADMEAAALRDQVKELSKQIKELSSQGPNYLDKAIGMVMSNKQIMRHLGFDDSTETVAEMADNKQVSGTEEEKLNRMADAIKKLGDADPNFVELLEKVAHIATNEKGKYDTYKPLIMNS